jgi:hypothetical protein
MGTTRRKQCKTRPGSPKLQARSSAPFGRKADSQTLSPRPKARRRKTPRHFAAKATAAGILSDLDLPEAVLTRLRKAAVPATKLMKLPKTKKA